MCDQSGSGPNLEKQLFGLDVVDQAGVVLVHDGQLTARRAHVQAAHRCVLLQQCDREWVIHKDLQNLPNHRTYMLDLLYCLANIL